MKIQYLLILLILAGCTTVDQPVQQHSSNQPLSIYFINVGQGDSALIQLNDKEVLIDCGKPSSGQTVLDFLKARNVDTLEYLILSKHLNKFFVV